MTFILNFVAAWIAFQIMFVVGAHTYFYVRGVRAGLGWSLQDYFTSLGVTLLGALGIWVRAIRGFGASILELGSRIRQKLSTKC